jgi:hypothetical protein
MALSWRSLSTERPATAQRAEQIAVASLRDGLARSLLEQASQRLSVKERQELASQLLLYSDAWKVFFNYLFLSTRGSESVTVVGRLSAVVSAAFHELFPEARVSFNDPAEFFKQRLAPESQDKVILLHELSRIQEGSRSSAREQKNLIEASFRALKRNRHLLIVDAGSLYSTNRTTGRVSSPEDEAKLLAREAYGRGLPLSEQELALAIYLLKDDIRAVAQAALSGEQVITNARDAGFAVDRWGGFGIRHHNSDKDLFSGIELVKP